MGEDCDASGNACGASVQSMPIPYSYVELAGKGFEDILYLENRRWCGRVVQCTCFTSSSSMPFYCDLAQIPDVIADYQVGEALGAGEDCEDPDFVDPDDLIVVISP